MDYTLITNEIVKLVILILASAGGLLVKKYLVTKASGEHFKILYESGRIVVSAIEQLADNAGWNNEEKHAFAVDWLKKMADGFGIDLSVEQANVILEGALSELKQVFTTKYLAKEEARMAGAFKVDKDK